MHDRLEERRPMIALDERAHLSFAGDRPHWGHPSVAQHKALRLPTVDGPWGCRLAHPVETLVGLHRRFPGWRAVTAVEHVLRTGFAWDGPVAPVRPQEILDLLDTLSAKTNGRARMTAALERADPRSLSVMETVLRLLLDDAGFPPPALNHRVPLGDGRRAYLDLAWPGSRTAVEYNGSVHHENIGAYRDEMHRLNQLRDLGWDVRVVVLDDLTAPARWSRLERWLTTSLTRSPSEPPSGRNSGSRSVRVAKGSDSITTSTEIRRDFWL